MTDRMKVTQKMLKEAREMWVDAVNYRNDSRGTIFYRSAERSALDALKHYYYLRYARRGTIRDEV